MCIKDVILDDETRAFTKGLEYKCYSSVHKVLWDSKRVLCAKNDMKKEHVIKELDNDRLDEFFMTCFEVIESVSQSQKKEI